MKRFGIIGYPLGHSFSKKYFTEKFEKEGLTDHVYELFPIESIERFPEIIRNHPDLVGLNVTIPYKQQVIPYIDELHLPGNVNACNCIRMENGRLHGYNTDITGFEKSFQPQLKSWHTSALVLGNGGATAAVVYVLQKLKIPYHIVSRQIHEGSSLVYEQLDEHIMDEHKIIINTTPLGTSPDIDHCAPIPYQFITDKHYLFDLIYNPAKTLFLRKGEESGAAIKNGYDMLIFQAEENWSIWNA